MMARCLVILGLAGLFSLPTGEAAAQGTVQARTAAERQMLALVNQLNIAVAQMQQSSQVTLPPFCAPFVGPFVAPGVRESLPLLNGCRTPAERRYADALNAQILNGGIINSMAHNCEMRRAPQPFDQSGILNPGWMWTPAGPVLKPCR